MSPRPSRKEELVEAALTAFNERGFEGTSIGQLSEVTGVSKAAFTYHFASKDELLAEAVAPLLDALSELQRRHPAAPSWPEGVRALLEDYMDVLVEHEEVAAWIDGDKSVLNHPTLGRQLRESNKAMRSALAGEDRSKRARVEAAAVLGMLWRPMRNLDASEVESTRDSLLDLAVDAVGTIRRPDAS